MNTDGHYKLVVAGEVFGRGTYEEVIKIQNMQRTVKSGIGKEHKLTAATMSIEHDPRPYPFQGDDQVQIITGYVGNKSFGPYK